MKPPCASTIELVASPELTREVCGRPLALRADTPRIALFVTGSVRPRDQCRAAHNGYFIVAGVGTDAKMRLHSTSKSYSSSTAKLTVLPFPPQLPDAKERSVQMQKDERTVGTPHDALVNYCQLLAKQGASYEAALN